MNYVDNQLNKQIGSIIEGYDRATRIAWAAMKAKTNWEAYLLWRAAVIAARSDRDTHRARAWWSNYAKARRAAGVSGALLSHRIPRTELS